MSAVNLQGGKLIAAQVAAEIQPSANIIDSINRSAQTRQKTAELCKLSDEISRIAGTLAKLSSLEPLVLKRSYRENTESEPNQVSADLLRSIVRARRLRDSYFPSDLFADPAWDMMLELLIAEIVQHRVPVSSLCASAAVPATTALRWIKSMTDRGLLRRREDPQDRRRVFIELEPVASAGIRRYFAELGSISIV
jgi:DNA-binding MarR family transcriptional regulator